MNQRVVYLDALRVFVIICVILIHSTAYINNIYGINSCVTILGNLCRFSVSLFIFLSGFCLSLKYLNNSVMNYGNFFVHYLWKLVPAYLIWNFVYQIHYQGCINLGISGLKSILYGNVASHLYFVPVIVGLYMVFPLLWKCRSKILVLLILSFIIQISAQIARHYAFSLEMPIAKDARAFPLLFIGYFVLGIFCAINLNKFECILHKYSFPFITATLLSFSLNTILPNDITYQLYYLLSIPTAFIIFRNVSNPVFSKLAMTGYYIYLMHYFILGYLVKYLRIAVLPPLFALFLSTLLTYALSYFCSFLYLKFKFVIDLRLNRPLV